jgi:hypothetical protein
MPSIVYFSCQPSTRFFRLVFPPPLMIMHTVVKKLQFNHTSHYKKYPSTHQQRQLSKLRLAVATTKTEKNIYNNPSLDFHQHLINQCPQRHQTTHKRNKQTNKPWRQNSPQENHNTILENPKSFTQSINQSISIFGISSAIIIIMMIMMIRYKYSA